jgi:hypothetical protein
MQRLLILLITCAIAIAQDPGARYLIITHDDFYDDILPLANWKHKKGMKTRIARLSETGSSSTDIRDYILNAYNNWQTPPEFLLLVGAPNFIPFPYVSGTISDNYYTNMDGDIFNEILSGRLTVHNMTEAQTVVNKILLYERTPYMADSLWMTNACLIVNEDYYGHDSVYVNDMRHAKRRMLSHGYHTIDTLLNSLGNNANDVIQSVNNGRAFVLYRGQGVSNWWSPFNVNPEQTNNGPKLPIVLSITCKTLGTSSTPATAERWLLTGTPTQPKGGAGYFATTTIGGGFITFLRSAICRGFFNALFVDDVRTFGEACEGGRQNVYALYSSQSEYCGFTTIGDPEMNIWTAYPCSLIVTHPALVPVGSTNITVNVVRQNNGSPIANALVCITAAEDTTVYSIDSTDANGNAVINLYPQVIGDTLYVTVTGKNLQPYEGFMHTTVAGSFVGYHASAIDDTIGGNANGQINPNEVINLRLWVKNYGDDPVLGILGILQTNDMYTTITDSVKSFGNMAAGQICSTGTDGYDFSLALNVPDGHSIDFTLNCRDTSNATWISYFSHTVHAPQLTYDGTTVTSSSGSLEPGDTANIVVSLHNAGSAAADSIAGILRTTSPLVDVLDSLGYYEHIPPDSVASNDANPFIITVDENAPTDTSVQFSIALISTHYVDTLWFSLRIGQKNFYIWNPDSTPTPGENMRDILVNLGYVGDYGTSLAADLGLYQAVFVCAGVFPYNHVIQSTSLEASTLVDYLQNQNGRLYLEGGDVWYFDPPTGYNFAPLFGINPSADGSSDMGPVIGQASTFTQTMSFDYGGENNWMDHIDPTGTGFLIFQDADDNYNCGVANDAGNYRTVGTSFELGLLADAAPPSTRAALLDSIMHFFGISTGVQDTKIQIPPITPALDIYPNPCRGILYIKLQHQDNTAPDNKVTIYDVSGRSVRQYTDLPNNQPVMWSGRDDQGRDLPGGIYFVKLQSDETTYTHKVIFLK